MAVDHDLPSARAVASSGSHAKTARASDARARESGAQAPHPADPLSDVLRAIRLSGALFFLVDARKPWIAAAPAGHALAPVILPGAQHVVSYHLVTEGSCWCSLAGEPESRLEAGDVIVIPHGDPYVLAGAAGARVAAPTEELLEFFERLAAGKLPHIVTEGGTGPERIRMACGFLGCDALPFNPVLSTLPRIIHVRAAGSDPGGRLRMLHEHALAESRDPRPGSASVLLLISELMFVEVIRSYVSGLPPEQTGWLAGLRDAGIGRALAAMHRQPARAWTLESIAREAGLSRSVLADRFAHFVGQPPMQYLTRWRLQLAARRLADGAAKVAAVALEVGYESEAAFSRAFKKAVGVSPGAWRRQRVATK